MLEFVKAQEKDVLNLARIKKTCWEQTYKNIYAKNEIEEFDFNKHANRFRLQLVSDYEQLYLILLDGRLIGYFNFGKTHYNTNKKVLGIPCVNSLNILEDYQHRGYGTKALNFIKDIVKEKNKLMYLCCNTYNEKAKNFLLKNGGAIIDETLSDNKSLCQLYIQFDLED